MSNWTGAQQDLADKGTLNMSQTVDGTMIFGYLNKSTTNDDGTLQLTSGGGAPEELHQKGGSGIVSTVQRNWGGNNLEVSNISNVPASVFQVAAIGMGMGDTPAVLPTDGSAVSLAGMGKTAQAVGSPKYLTLRMQANTSEMTIFAVIGGPATAGVNGYTFGLNWSSNTGPAKKGVPPLDGFYETTSDNKIDFQFNWGPSSPTIWVANFSSAATSAAQVSLIGMS